MCSITNPDSFIRSKDEKEIGAVLDQIAAETVEVSQWKRVNVEIGGQVKDKTWLVSVKVPTEEFKIIFKNEMESFRKHVIRVNHSKSHQRFEREAFTWTSYAANRFCRRLPLPTPTKSRMHTVRAANVTIFPHPSVTHSVVSQLFSGK